MSRKQIVGALATILLISAGLRFYRLASQSLWYDEGISAQLAQRNLLQITASAKADIHPPLYYYTLHFWNALFGSSEFALRSLSVGFGLLLVYLIFALGRALFDEPTGLVAAAIAAINPFQVYYSQEARMYVMLAAVSALAVLALVRWLETGSRRWAALWVLANSAGLYTHYAFPAVLVAENLAWAVWWLLGSRRVPLSTSRLRWGSILLGWLGMQVLTMILYIPWLPIAIQQLAGWGGARAVEPAGSALVKAVGLLGFGLSGPPGEETGTVAGCILVFLALVGPMWLLVEPDELTSGFEKLDSVQVASTSEVPVRSTWLPYWSRYAIILAWLVVPVVAVIALGLFTDNYLKFLLVSSPPLCLLLAHGAVVAWRLAHGPLLSENVSENSPHSGDRHFQSAGHLAAPGQKQSSPGEEEPAFHLRSLSPWHGVMLLLAGIWLVYDFHSLNRLYFDPTYARDDYRGLAQHLVESWRPGDVVLLDAPGQIDIFSYYFPNTSAVVPVARTRPVQKTQQRTELQNLVKQYQRVFAVFWGDQESDPDHVVERWLNRHGYIAGNTWYGGIRLVTYGVAPCSTDPDCALEQPAHQLADVQVGENVRLVAGIVPETPVRPGDVLSLQLIWQTDSPVPERYKVFVHLMDEHGNLIAQHDDEPQGGNMPTNTWQPGKQIIDNHGILIPAQASPGHYHLYAGLVRPDGQRLPVRSPGQPANADQISVGTLEISAAEPQS